MFYGWVHWYQAVIFNSELNFVQAWQMEWDMSGMTLATTGDDGRVRLWQSNLNGVWHEQAAIQPTTQRNY